MSVDSSNPTELPPSAVVQQVVFTAKPEPGQEVLVELPSALQRWGVVVPASADSSTLSGLNSLLILTLPRSASATEQEEGMLLAQLQRWVEAGVAARQLPSMLMTLQGTQIFWTQGRCAILAPADRLPAVRAAAIEAFFYEGELREIEQKLGESWPQMEADIPAAFEFGEASIGKRKQLKHRFQQTLLLRARLARIAPHVHAPHLHPPTLASQVGERLRERTRMEHRHEFLDEQIEVFEEVYGMCSERSSDFMNTRSGNTLEWIIIVLLLLQLLMAGFEMITSVGP